MKKSKKLLLVIICILIIEVLLPRNYSKAGSQTLQLTDGGGSSSESSSDDGSVSSVVGSVSPDPAPANSNISGISDVIATILGVLQVLSGLISVVVIALTGFRYITADTPDFKRELKEKMLPIVIGIVLVFEAITISKFILGVAG